MRNKRSVNYLFIALAMILFTGQVSAQSFGIRGGVNISKNTNDNAYPESDIKSINGLSAAVYVDIPLVKILSIQPEFNFIQKGSSTTATVLGVEGIYKTRLNYVELPILLKARLGSSEGVHAYLALGPNFGYAISGTTSVEIAGNKVTNKYEFDNDDNDGDGYKDNRLDATLTVGGGFAIPVGMGSLIIDARYHIDANDAASFRDGKPDAWENTANRGLNLSLGLQIPFGG